MAAVRRIARDARPVFTTRWYLPPKNEVKPPKALAVVFSTHTCGRQGYEGANLSLEAMMKTPRERRLYPLVQRWVKRNLRCFKAETNRGLSYGRIDVIGIRDVGGGLSGEVETIAIEVKKGATPFGTACGQTLGYNVYANRVYLADKRLKSFSPDELQIASHLGIGLIQIRDGQCKEILSSPFYNPIPKLNLQLLENLRLGKCQFCGSFFATGEMRPGHRYSKLTVENIRKAIQDEKGTIFYLYEVDERKYKMRISGKPGVTSDRRFICPDCIYSFFAKLPASA